MYVQRTDELHRLQRHARLYRPFWCNLPVLHLNTPHFATVVDWTSAELLLDHWLGNVRWAGIDYFLIAAADVRTAQHMGDVGLASRCYLLEAGDGVAGGMGPTAGGQGEDIAFMQVEQG